MPFWRKKARFTDQQMVFHVLPWLPSPDSLTREEKERRSRAKRSRLPGSTALSTTGLRPPRA